MGQRRRAMWLMTTNTRGRFYHGDYQYGEAPRYSVDCLERDSDVEEITPEEVLAELGDWGEAIDDAKAIFGRHPMVTEEACDCGEQHPDNLEHCASPNCTNTGCDACGEIEWCGDEHDEDCGDWFCGECRK